MKKNIVRLFFLLMLPIFLNAQKIEDKRHSDSIEIRFNELLDVDYRIKIILDDFLQNMPFSLRRPQRKNIIIVEIDEYLTFRAQSSLIDSLYQDNDFQKSIYSFPYSVYIESIRNNSRRLFSFYEFKQCYLYDYKSFDVIIVSPMQLKFPWIGSSVIKQYMISEDDDITSSYFSVYTIGDFEVVKREYIKLYSKPSGIRLKKKYFIDKEKSDLLRSN